jgi:AraC-like DNA-binding protein
MKKSLRDLIKMIDLCSPGDGLHQSPVPGVNCIKFSQPNQNTKRTWSACLGIVAQGWKEFALGGEIYRSGEGEYIVAPIDLPVTSRISSATPDAPYLCLKIDFDPRTLSEVAAQFETNSPAETGNPSHAIFTGKATDEMLDAAVRLGKLFQTPEDAPVLGPLAIKEMLYHLLKGANGPAIRQFARAGSKMHKISQAIHTLRADLDEEVDVTALANAANMGRSAFFKHFKEVTAMSPIQYQKRLRLLEARRLMTDEGETAGGSAFKVGYNSASQFSREYSRTFGNSPVRDATKIKNGEPIYQI